MLASLSSLGAPINGTGTTQAAIVAFITAGTTQTQAGATLCTAPTNVVTVGTASDGVLLPDGSNPLNIGMRIRIRASHASNALKVYPYYGLSVANPVTAAASGGNISATSSAGTANIFYSHPAGVVVDYELVGSDVWKAIPLAAS